MCLMTQVGTKAHPSLPSASTDAVRWHGAGRLVRIVRSLYVAAMAVILFLASGGLAHAQTDPPPAPQASELNRIDRLEQLLESVREENRRLLEEFRVLREKAEQGALERRLPSFGATTGGASGLVPAAAFGSSSGTQNRPDQSADAPMPAFEAGAGLPTSNVDRRFDYKVGYDNGFVFVPNNPQETPFSLKISSQNVIRYDAFLPGAKNWTDSAGNSNPINESSFFAIPRGRLIFSGNALLPDLSYRLNIDYNSVTSNPIGFRAYELSYRFDRAFELHAGQSKVPGTREWLQSAFAALEGPDRTMATTFFRPSLSQGVWITGEPIDGFYYHAMMSNGFNTLNLSPNQLFQRYCWSGSAWWEPWGDFGQGYADFEAHEEAVVRVGASCTFALGSGSQTASDAVENSAIRLSDGTLITQQGAIAPGVTLRSYDISLAAVDFAFKRRGLSLSTEWYAQNLSSLVGDGPLPIRSTQAYGGFVQGGYFIVPQEYELYARTSFVNGHYGSGSEWAGGLNWFIIPGKSNLRFTLDAAWLNNSPADQNRTGFTAGQTGVLLRTQLALVY